MPLIFLLMGAMAGAWHNRAVDHGRVDMVTGSVRQVVMPPASGLGRAARWLRDGTASIFAGRGAAAENRKLRARVAVLEQQLAALREAQIQNDRLRADLGFVRTRVPRPLAAEVIARRPDPKFDTMIISRGNRDGVRPNSVVVTRQGVVGRVFEVTANTSSVLMLTDQNSGVGARVQRESSRAEGVCKGDNSPMLTMVYLSNDADIKPGDLIVTSGLGGVYPRGLPMGIVTQVRNEDANLLKVARVKPMVQFDRVEEVYVLL